MNPLINSFSSDNAVKQAIKLLQSNSPEDVLMAMLQSNPRFKQFYDQNKGKTVEQISQDYGLDLRMVRNILNQK